MIWIGLTGSIGMGKSTVSRQARALGIPFIDADSVVHRLYERRDVVMQIERKFPGVVKGGKVDRKALGGIIFFDDAARLWLEALLHPLVWQVEKRFGQRLEKLGTRAALFDIPLLYETNSHHRFDLVLVASAPYFLQQQRVLKRPNMTPQKFREVLARQLPDRQKRRLADAVIPTGLGKAYSMRKLKEALWQNVR